MVPLGPRYVVPVTDFKSNRRSWSPQVVAKSFLTVHKIPHGLKLGNIGAFVLC